jgi:single-stranded-DNA-specific exonuclease
LSIDAYLGLPDLQLDLVAEMDRLAPFGPGNPPLVFAARNLRTVSHALLGRSGEHIRIVVEDENERRQTVFWWQGAGRPLPRDRFDLAFTLQASDYRGAKEVQINWLDARQREPSIAVVRQGPAFAVVDHRTVLRPDVFLRSLLEEDEIQVWAEAHDLSGLNVCTRLDLVPRPTLAVWTLPPGPQELQEALHRAQPAEVLYFSHEPELDNPAALLPRLAGLVKYALQARGGKLNLEVVAAARAQRVAAVVAGLEWLDATGRIRIEVKKTDLWQISQGPTRLDPQAAKDSMAMLAGVLAETAAYRDYVRHVPIDALGGS